MIYSPDARVKDWPFMSSPVPTIMITIAYLYFIKILGPQLMKDRKPYDLRTVMIIYNFMMVIVSTVMFIEV